MATREEISAGLLSELSEFVARRTGLYFPRERRRDLVRGISSAAGEFGFGDVSSCVRWLLTSPLTREQVEVLAGHLTVGETYFFRDRKCFDILEHEIFPELLRKRRQAGRYLRIWSVGCATGEEPYSVAILLHRMIHDIEDWNITIVATDINASFLGKAAGGIYGGWSFRDVPSWVKKAYFKKNDNGTFELFPSMRKSVTFSYHNLAEDAYPSLANNTNAMDLIFCRNVLMYFSRETQTKAIRKFYRCIVNGGWLIVSPTEIFSSVQSSPFIPVQFSGWTIYRKDVSKEAASGSRLPGCRVAGSIDSATTPTFRPAVGSGGYTVFPPLTEGDEGKGAPGGLSEQSAVGPSIAPEEATSYREALKLYEQGRYSEAEERITSVLSVDKGNGPALGLLSRIYANRGLLPDARTLCEKAITADKLNPAYYYLLATILLEMGLGEESEKCLKRTLYLDQGFALAHFALGNSARRNGRKKESGRHYKNALAVLQRCRPEDIVPESEGITTERMIEVINAMLIEETLA